ncbi:hypothetical protein [Pseudoalteromonas sp. GB56]
MTRKFVVGTLALLIGAVLFVFWLGTDITSGLQTQQTPVAEPPKLTVPFTDKESEAQERVEAASANLDFASKESAQTHEIRLCDKADGVNAALEQKILQAKDVDFVQQFKQSNALASQWAYSSVAELTPKRKSQTLAQLANDNPSNQVVYYDLMLSCLSSDAECAPSIFARGTEIHGQNGAFWLLSAIDHINHQREEMAISALRQAALSPVYDELWGEHFALFEEAVRATPVQSDIGQQMTVMGLMAASTNMPYNEIMALCKGAGLNRLDIKEVCIQVGQRLETGRTPHSPSLLVWPFRSECMNTSMMTCCCSGYRKKEVRLCV